MSAIGELTEKWSDRIQHSRPVQALLARNDALLGRADVVLKSGPVWWLAVLAVAALQTSLILTHRPWLDEYQAVQLAVQAPDVATLLDWLRYEGHPPLFYLLLRGLAHFMDPLTTLPVLALVIAAITQATILFASPFSRAERLLISLGEFMLFDFLALSRSMNLGVLMLVLAMALWRRRAVWLAIAILPFCDFLFGVLSGVLVLVKWREKSLWWPGISLWLAGGMAAGWSVLPAPDAIPALETLGFGKDTMNWLSSVGTLALPFQGGIFPEWNVQVWPLGGILWVPFLWFAWSESGKEPFHRLMMFGFILLTYVFSVVVYPLALRHLMLIALLLLLFCWRRRDAGGATGPGFRLWLAAVAACGLGTAAVNFVVPFDKAPEALAEIRARGLEDKHWMVFPDSRAQGVAALSGMLFERTERHCMEDFIRWDYRTTLLKPELLAAYLEDEISRHGRFYLLSDLDLSAIPADLLVELHHEPRGYWGQDYNLYLVGPSAKERPVILPRCVPEARPFARLAH